MTILTKFLIDSFDFAEGEQPWRPWERQEICGLSHNAPQDFTLPGLSVSVPNSHKCDFEVCNATFKRESELKRHKLSKHFRKYERCKVCTISSSA